MMSKTKLALLLGAALIVGVAIGTTPPPTETETTTETAVETVEKSKKKSEPATEPTVAESSSDAISASKREAVESAQGYLDMGSGFSRKGLIEQLTSEVGEGYPRADAEYAVEHLSPDWNEQAVFAAKGYMEMGGFSRSALIEQLVSDYGHGFTQAQAEYAAGEVYR